MSMQTLFQSYLFAFVFWICLSLGCFGLMLVQHVVRASWGRAVLRLLEAGAKTLPLMALLFLPILFGAQNLYEWMDPQAVRANHALQMKHDYYLNLPFFAIRAAIRPEGPPRRWSAAASARRVDGRNRRLEHTMNDLSSQPVAFTPQSYKSGYKPIWCPGCGDYSVLSSLTKALAKLALPPHEVAVVSGIGCSSRLPGYVDTYGFNSLHGRSLPIAMKPERLPRAVSSKVTSSSSIPIAAAFAA